jgi:hypothetical protein
VWKCICVRNEKQRAWPGERHNGSSSIPVVAGDPVRAVVDALVSNLFWFPAKAGHGQERGEHASTATRLTPTAQWRGAGERNGRRHRIFAQSHAGLGLSRRFRSACLYMAVGCGLAALACVDGPISDFSMGFSGLLDTSISYQFRGVF